LQFVINREAVFKLEKLEKDKGGVFDVEDMDVLERNVQIFPRAPNPYTRWLASEDEVT